MFDMENRQTKTTIILVRHGESLANAAGVYLGHTDWDLSEKGKDQARAVAEYLKNEKIDAIYSSDLIRAYNTALPHSQIHSLPIIKSRDLREIYLGEWEGKSLEELDEEYPVEFSIGWRENFGTCRIPSGEDVPLVAQRIYNEIVRIGAENPGKTVLVATHAAAIRSFWGKVTHTPAEEVAERIPFPRNASCTTVIYNGEGLVPIKYGDAHYFDKKTDV